MGVTVRQKTKGKGKPWWVFIAHNGKRTSKKVGDKAAAQEVASKIRAKLQLGEFGFEEKRKVPTFKLYAEGFMETYSAMNHKKSTHDSYRSVLNLHILPWFEDMALDSITRKDVKDFISQKHKEGLSSGTVRILKAYLSCILSEAVDDELILVNPAARTGKYIKAEEGNNQVKPFTWEETNIFEKAIQKHFPRYYPFFLCALRTGMREGVDCPATRGY